MQRTWGSPRLWAILTAISGLATLAVSVAFRLLPSVQAAGPCLGDNAVLDFEFATRPSDLTAIFGPAGDSCRPDVIAAMDAINTLDVFAYIPAYTAFAICAALFLSAGRLRPLTMAAIALAALALAADYVETVTLLAITPGLEAEAARLQVSSIAAWTKFAALAAHATVLALMAFQAAPRQWLLGIPLLAPPLGLMAAFADRGQLTYLLLSFVIAWVPMMGMAIFRAIRPAP